MDIKAGVSTLVGQDTDLCESVQCDFMGNTQDIKDVVPYGFAHKCPTGSYYVIFQARKNADDNFGIGNEYETMPKGLSEGETVIYNSLTGNQIYLKEDGTTNILLPDGTSIILSPGKKIKMVGDLEVVGKITSSGNISAPNVIVNNKPVDGHVHVDPQGGSTGAF